MFDIRGKNGVLVCLYFKTFFCFLLLESHSTFSSQHAWQTLIFMPFLMWISDFTILLYPAVTSTVCRYAMSGKDITAALWVQCLIDLRDEQSH